MTVAQLRSNIEKNKIEHFYLFTGPEIGEKNEIIELIEQKVFAGQEKVTYNLFVDNELNPSDISDAVESNMLFSSKKIIYIKNIEQAGTKIQKTLESIIIPQRIASEVVERLKNARKNADVQALNKCYSFDESKNVYIYNCATKETDKKKLIATIASNNLHAIDGDTYIIMINETNDKVPSGITNLVGADQQITFWEMFDNQKPQWIRSEFKKRDLYIEDAALEFIVDTVENNKLAFINEIQRICTYYEQSAVENVAKSAQKVITRDLIESYLYHSKEETAFSLYSALLARNPTKALSILDKIFYTDEDSIVAGLMWSHKRFLKLLNLVENEKMPAEVAFGQMFIKMKKAQQELAVGLKNYTFNEATMLTYQVVQLEYYSRFLSSDLKRVKFQQFIIDFINKKNLDQFWLGENILLSQ